MVRKKAKKKECCDYATMKIVMGIALLIVAGMLYSGYGWMEIFALFGVLAILKGLWLKFK